MRHICIGKLTIIGSYNGLSPERCQAIIWTNAGILLMGPLGTNFSEILIEIQTFSLKKIRLKMSSAKWCCFRLCLNELTVRHTCIGRMKQKLILYFENTAMFHWKKTISICMIYKLKSNITRMYNHSVLLTIVAKHTITSYTMVWNITMEALITMWSTRLKTMFCRTNFVCVRALFFPIKILTKC